MTTTENVGEKPIERLGDSLKKSIEMAFKGIESLKVKDNVELKSKVDKVQNNTGYLVRNDVHENDGIRAVNQLSEELRIKSPFTPKVISISV